MKKYFLAFMVSALALPVLADFNSGSTTPTQVTSAPDLTVLDNLGILGDQGGDRDYDRDRDSDQGRDGDRFCDRWGHDRYGRDCGNRGITYQCFASDRWGRQYGVTSFNIYFAQRAALSSCASRSRTPCRALGCRRVSYLPGDVK